MEAILFKVSMTALVISIWCYLGLHAENKVTDRVFAAIFFVSAPLFVITTTAAILMRIWS